MLGMAAIPNQAGPGGSTPPSALRPRSRPRRGRRGRRARARRR
jgi:hypothetical protein